MRQIVGLLVFSVVVSGCGDTGPSAGCLEDMEEAAGISDSSAAEPVLVRTLTSCETADQWLEALRQHPAAMGLTESAVIGEVDLQAACFGNEDRPVCESWLAS